MSALKILQDKMDLLLEGQEIHFEDVEDLEEKVGEAQKDILANIEEGSNALREKTERVVSAANAAKAAFYSLLEVVGIVSTLGFVVWLLSSLARNPQAQELARKKLARFFPPKKEETKEPQDPQAPMESNEPKGGFRKMESKVPKEPKGGIREMA